ncbi:MAG: class II fumarate hydratase [Granulosicoccus sp.]|nr:class II fumarate hydratase [Granulosicoccus sp.]
MAHPDNDTVSVDTRQESDSLGLVRIEATRYWGAQTQRCLQNFPIGKQRMPIELVHALGTIKLAACETNRELGLLEESLAQAICTASREVLRGELDDHFPLPVWQTGSGTHSNMNVNEVISNRANELMGGNRGDRFPVHPNDHVNMSQSSNDTFPTAIHIASALVIVNSLLPAIEYFHHALQQKAIAWDEIVKVGRTHLQDATPIRLGQVFSGYAAQIDSGRQRILRSLPGLYEIAQGGTAVGTGLNTPAGFAEKIAMRIAELTGLPFVTAPNKFAAQAAHDSLVDVHAALNTLAVACFKIANDIRYLASGPRAGLGELLLPANEPGSSIMPGKVNPTQCEAVTQVCVQVHGNNAAMTLAGNQGQFELIAYKPLMARMMLESAQLLADVIDSFTRRCVTGIEANTETIDEDLHRSLMLVTALVPLIGYDKAATVAKMAHANRTSLRHEAISQGFISDTDYERLMDPRRMTEPG